MPQPLQATSLEASFFRLLPGELFGFNSQGTVDILESEVLFHGGSSGTHPSESSTGKGKDDYPSFFPSSFLSYQKFFFFF